MLTFELTENGQLSADTPLCSFYLRADKEDGWRVDWSIKVYGYVIPVWENIYYDEKDTAIEDCRQAYADLLVNCGEEIAYDDNMG